MDKLILETNIIKLQFWSYYLDPIKDFQSWVRLIDAKAIVDEVPIEEGEPRGKSLGNARPFSHLQQRLGRKKVSERMLRENPVAYPRL